MRRKEEDPISGNRQSTCNGGRPMTDWKRVAETSAARASYFRGAEGSSARDHLLSISETRFVCWASSKQRQECLYFSWTPEIPVTHTNVSIRDMQLYSSFKVSFAFIVYVIIKNTWIFMQLKENKKLFTAQFKKKKENHNQQHKGKW